MDRRFRGGKWALLLLCGLVVAVACSPAAPTPSAPQRPPPQPAAPSAPPPAAAGQAAAPTPTAPATIRIGVPTLDLDFTLPFSVTEKLGFLQEARLDVQIREMPTNPQIAALMNRELDLAIVSGVLAAATRGADVRYIYGPYYTSNFYLVVNSDKVRRPTDLVGQPLAIGSVGGSGEVATRRMLASLGVDPTSVAYINLGPSSARIAGMLSGQIAGTALLPDPAIRLRREGFPIIADSTKLLVQPQGGFGAHLDYLKDHRPTVKAWLRATLQALLYIQQNPEAAAEIVTEATQLDRDVVREAMPLVLAALSTDDLGGSTERELQDTLKAITDSEPELAGKQFPLDRIVDFGPLREVQRDLGLPCHGGYQCPQ
jgi:ABC-type nitrate/sulfonate/bicarbonate transport system substrate-binding protein